MEKLLIKGDVYTVATKTECTVTSANGTPLGKATAENPVSFTATTDRVELSDPDAEFARVNPKYAPVKLRLLGLLGGGSSAASPLPAGYIAADFLEGTGSQYVALPEFVFSSEDDIEWLIAFSNYPSTGNFGVWSCMNAHTVRQVAVMSMGGYVFNFFGGEIYSGTFEPGVYAFRNNGLYINGNLKKSLSITPKNTTSLYLFCQRYNNVPSYFAPVALSYFKVKGKLNLLPAIDASGAPCMFDAETKTPYYNSGSGAFVVGLNLKQARQLAKLPAGGGTLTVSLPWEAQLVQHNAEVVAALQAAKSNGWTITVQYREPEADSALYNKYAECTTATDMESVNADYKNDLTADGEWIYPLPELQDASFLMRYADNLRVWRVDLPKATKMARAFSDCPNLLLVEGKFSACTNVEYMCTSGGGAGFVFRAAMPKLKNALRAFTASGNLVRVESDFTAITSGFQTATYANALTYWASALPNLGDGTVMFYGCQLDKESTLRVVNSLRAYTSGSHSITMGIHIDHQTDEEVLSAIAEAETKGWTLTVQWNGTPTAAAASTFGLRRMPVYAKLGTLDRPDGTTEQVIDWGHYVTNWEANGYQEFASVEEAKEYFNIKETNHETF